MLNLSSFSSEKVLVLWSDETDGLFDRVREKQAEAKKKKLGEGSKLKPDDASDSDASETEEGTELWVFVQKLTPPPPLALQWIIFRYPMIMSHISIELMLKLRPTFCRKCFDVQFPWYFDRENEPESQSESVDVKADPIKHIQGEKTR